MDLQGKVALVTGGGTGLGFAISSALAARGCAIGVNYPGAREEESTQTVETLRTAGVDAALLRGDVSREQEVDLLVSQVVERFGRFDVLINNAGTTAFVPMDDLDGMRPAEWDRILAVNVKGPFLVSRAAAPHLRASGNGAIVNTASISGLRVGGSCLAYGVSKAGLIHLTRCLAVALAPTVRVNAIAPGSMATNWYPTEIRPDYDERAASTPLKRIPKLEDIAAMVVTLVENDSITGQTVVIDSGVLVG
jgi:NAD(P)-dependent dehydrogenase (short-subunit alcohol dehydrogenase family)